MVELESDYGYCGVAADESNLLGRLRRCGGRVGGGSIRTGFITGLQACSVAIWDGKLYFGEISEWWTGNGHISRAS